MELETPWRELWGFLYGEGMTEYPRKDVLDHGFVRLVDHMGSDQRIVDAARVSYQKGTQKVSTDRGLIRYLLMHMHTTPFEKVRFEFHVKLPIFVARQWMRHRMSSYNEVSARYSVLPNEMYNPEKLREQLKDLMLRMGLVKERLPGKAKYMVLKYLKMGVIGLEDIGDFDMRCLARLYLRGRRLKDEIWRLEQVSEARMRRRVEVLLG